MTISKLPIQFIYQDVDFIDIDQISFIFKNQYDILLFNYTNTFQDIYFSSINVQSFTYSEQNQQWYIQARIDLRQPIQLYESTFDSIIRLLNSSFDKPLTLLTSTGNFKFWF